MDKSILGGTAALKIPFRNLSSFRSSLFGPCKRAGLCTALLWYFRSVVPQIPNNPNTGDTHNSALAPEKLCREPLYYFTGPYKRCKTFCADFCTHALRSNLAQRIRN